VLLGMSQGVRGCEEEAGEEGQEGCQVGKSRRKGQGQSAGARGGVAIVSVRCSAIVVKPIVELPR
jgi:hypothetical protein